MQSVLLAALVALSLAGAGRAETTTETADVTGAPLHLLSQSSIARVLALTKRFDSPSPTPCAASVCLFFYCSPL